MTGSITGRPHAFSIIFAIRIVLIPVFLLAIVGPWTNWVPDWSDAERWKPWVAAAVFILLCVTDTVEPEPELAARYEEQYRKFRLIYPALKMLFPKLK